MVEYIDRQAAIDAIHCDITITGRQNAELVATTIGTFADRIKAIPAADVVPVHLGEWLDGYKMQTCSLCKCRGKKSWTFCPHCGARMIYGERKE